jgi:hypothetical protein
MLVFVVCLSWFALLVCAARPTWLNGQIQPPDLIKNDMTPSFSIRLVDSEIRGCGQTISAQLKMVCQVSVSDPLASPVIGVLCPSTRLLAFGRLFKSDDPR